MKKTVLFSVTFLMVFSALAQDITGQWHGMLDQIQLRLVLNISQSDDGYTATLDSPDQGANDIPVTTTTFDGQTLEFTVINLGISYSGNLVDNDIKGTFKQGGAEMSLELSRGKLEKQVVNRPQEPKEPYSYRSEEVKFENAEANISLAGTLTLPKNKGVYPAVILISGSGPQDRNEELAGHKPFLVIADHLTKNGIAVLRCDDRGFGKSTGDFKAATSEDFATDATSAISYLKTRKEVDPNKIGLVGHSEGGMIAPMVAEKSKDVDFIVLMAGPGISGDKILLLQQGLIAKANGTEDSEIEKSRKINTKAFEMIVNSQDIPTLKTDLTNYLKEVMQSNPEEIPKEMTSEEFIAAQIDQIATPWMVFFMKHDPAKVLEKVDCPVLAINGEKDLQVPPKENLSAIENALKKGGNKTVTLIELPKLNHLFQESETGSPSEYGQIEQTFSPIALEEITNWILKQNK